MQFVTIREEAVLSDSQRINAIEGNKQSEESLPEDAIIETVSDESNLRK
jgi:hypothetical protein